ncbi:MAG: TIGR00296 family protein [Candidatus ainarchaeum sp.]|nr:TIGR00296 family protein [Candidatus ainarchaeum sp.]MDD5163319.1 TIGR00296 family protein [Candidatus ainarchaeum sp.]
MPELLSLEDGKELVKLARKSIEYYSATGAFWREKAGNDKFLKERGVFVTINEFPSKELRGCIGFPYGVKPLWEATIEVAIEAGFHDPRFLPLKAEELEKILIEVSVLTAPEEIFGEKKDCLKKIKIGQDGLIVQRGYRSGLLLPIVPVNYAWNSETLLEQTCIKAGLPKATWRSAEVHVFKFCSQIFTEKQPNGKIEEINLEESLKK